MTETNAAFLSSLSEQKRSLFDQNADAALTFSPAYGILGELSAVLLAAVSARVPDAFSDAERTALSFSVRSLLSEKTEAAVSAELLYTVLLSHACEQSACETGALLLRVADAVSQSAPLFYATRALSGEGRECRPHDGALGFLHPLLLAIAERNDAAPSHLSSLLRKLLEENGETLAPEGIFSHAALLLLSLAYGDAEDEVHALHLATVCESMTEDGSPFFSASASQSAFFQKAAPFFYALRGKTELVRCQPEEKELRSPQGCFDYAFSSFLFVLAAQKRRSFGGAFSLPTPQSLESEASILLLGKQRRLGFSANTAELFFGTSESRFSLSVAPIISLFSDCARVTPQNARLSSMKGGFLSYGTCRVDADAGEAGSGVSLGRLSYAYAALPDDETLLFLSSFTAERSFTSRALSPLALRVLDPTSEASYYYGGERHSRARLLKKPPLSIGKHCQMSDKLGLVTTSELALTLGEEGDLLLPASMCEPRPWHMGEESSFDGAVAVGSVRRTYALLDQLLTLSGLPRGVKSVSAVAANRKRYTLLYNLSDAPFLWEGHALPSGNAVLLAWDR